MDAERNPEQDPPTSAEDDSRVAALRRELAETKERLRRTVEDLGRTNEELTVANEELARTNEELQTVNRSLYSVNVENEARLDLVAREKADMDHLLSATEVGVLFVDRDLAVRRFTHESTRTFALSSADVGRPLREIEHSLELDDLAEIVGSVADGSGAFQREVGAASGHSYLLRILPYVRRGELSGAIVTLVDVTDVRDARRRLARFEGIVEKAADMYALIDERGKLEYANHAFCDSLEYSSSELMTRSIPEIDTEWTEDRFREFWESHDVGEGQLFETTHRRSDGSRYPAEVSASKVELDGRRFIFANARDVTLRHVRSQYAEFDRSIALLTLGSPNEDEMFHAVADLAVRVLGALAASVWTYSPAQSPTLARCAHAAADRLSDDVDMPDLDGEVYTRLVNESWSEPGVRWNPAKPTRGARSRPDVVSTAIRVEFEGHPMAVLTLELRSDAIPSTRLFERAMTSAATITGLQVHRYRTESQLLLRDRAMAATHEGIVIADAEDPDLPLVYVNRGFERITGYSAEEVIGRNCRFLQGPETSTEPRDEMREALLERRRVQTTILNYRKDGTPFWNEVQITPVADDTGRVRHFVAVQHDITKRIETEHDLDKTRRRATSASRAKSRFLATMSHEIRSPMTAILGFTDVLRRTVDDSEALEVLGGIRRNADYALQLFGDILDISKIEAGKLEIESTVVDLPMLLLDVADMMSVRSDEKDVRFDVRLAGPIPDQVVLDATRLRQILINLIANAIKFTDEGTVEVEASMVPTDPPLARSATLVFVVKDTGVGIPPDGLETIFLPFARPHAEEDADGARFEGSGLGLSIVKRLIGALGATIEVESRLGVGSRFEVTLPCPVAAGASLVHELVSKRREADRPCEDSPDEPLRGRRVLVADDRPDVARVIEFYLEDAGAEVDTVTNGREAVDAVLAATGPNAHDVIVLDMQMPVMDGYEAARELRARGYGGPIVALTAGAMKADKARAIDAGCSAFLTKPADEQTLIEILVREVEAKRD